MVGAAVVLPVTDLDAPGVDEEASDPRSRGRALAGPAAWLRSTARAPVYHAGRGTGCRTARRDAMVGPRMTTSARPRPLVLVILDGFGERAERADNAVRLAATPALSAAPRTLPARSHRSERTRRRPAPRADGQQRGRAPQLRRGSDRGDGHLAHRRGARGRRLARNPVIVDVVQKAKGAGGRLHLLGLLSDGGVHSSMAHLFASSTSRKQRADPGGPSRVPRRARRAARYRAAVPLGGRSAIWPAGVGRIGTVGGRYWAMDRDNRWERVERAYRAIAEASAARGGDRQGRHRTQLRGRQDRRVRRAIRRQVTTTASGPATRRSTSTSGPTARASSRGPSRCPRSTLSRGPGGWRPSTDATRA